MVKFQFNPTSPDPSNSGQNSGQLIPFGKYAGKPVESLAADPQYVEWLVSQPWFRERHVSLYNVVINNFTTPNDTPEHNQMQVRFLDEQFRIAFAMCAISANCREEIYRTNALCARAICDSIRVAASRIEYSKIFDKVYASRPATGYRRREDPTATIQYDMFDIVVSKSTIQLTTEISNDNLVVKLVMGLRDRNGSTGKYLIEKVIPSSLGSDLITASSPEFENNGLDVCYSLTGFNASKAEANPRGYRIEIKPTVADDFPAVLRQIRRNKANCLLIREYNGSVEKNQFADFFRSQGVIVVYESDVDAMIGFSVEPLGLEKVAELVKQEVVHAND